MANSSLADDNVIIVYYPNLHEGLLGIYAGQIAEEFKKPCFVLTDSDVEGVAKGSGRSVAEVNKLRQMIDQQRKMGKQLANIDEEKAAKLASQVESGNYAGLKSTMGQPKPYVHKGKGKNKGGFRF